MPDPETLREQCLAHFRKAVALPESVPPWTEWWRDNESLVEQAFPLMEYVRLKHRRLLGARQILQANGDLPTDYQPLSAAVTGTCPNCGDRVTRTDAPTPEGKPQHKIQCPNCGSLPICTCNEEPTH
ncbi:MAG: hypothetical protein KDA68_09885 [Planctomycetaceae bacterium]|nr:hypothetical protein [Planctomycetaceae bacterium]